MHVSIALEANLTLKIQFSGAGRVFHGLLRGNAEAKSGYSCIKSASCAISTGLGSYEIRSAPAPRSGWRCARLALEPLAGARGRVPQAKFRPMSEVGALARTPAAQSRVIICVCPRTATLQTPLAVTERLLFRAAVQSNEVYPPRLAPLPLAGIVARQINADR